MSNKLFSKTAVAIFAVLLAAPFSHALQSDKDQPIEIESDRALRDEQSGITVYEGAVVVTQGTMRIDADKVTIYTVGENANRIVCEGIPALFQQQINPEEGLVKGKANQINYDRGNENIVLTDDARVTRADGTEIESNTIKYSLNSKRINAESEQGGRVHMIIPPKTKEDKDGDS